jgi:hypothetical protein
MLVRERIYDMDVCCYELLCFFLLIWFLVIQGWTESGEFLEYHFYIPSDDNFDIWRVATNSPGKRIRIEVNPVGRVPYSKTFTVIDKGWQDFTDIVWDLGPLIFGRKWVINGFGFILRTDKSICVPYASRILHQDIKFTLPVRTRHCSMLITPIIHQKNDPEIVLIHLGER